MPRVIMRLEGDTEGTGCDCALLTVDEELVQWMRTCAQSLMELHEKHPDVYKIDIWGHNAEFYSGTLVAALIHANVCSEDESWNGAVVPDSFEIPSDYRPERVACLLTEVSQPSKWDDVNGVDFQFSAEPKHMSVTVRTRTITLGRFEQLLAS